MVRIALLLSLLCWSSRLIAQPIDFPGGNDPFLTGGKSVAETAVGVGRSFMGRPYVPHTLEQGTTEQLVVNLQAFDCTTFVETMAAFSLAWHNLPDKTNRAELEGLFRQFLTKLRYRNGQIDGYASRLHYFSEWLRDNERKGLVQDITAALPGSITVSKPLSYMTTKVDRYPALHDPAVYQQIARVETSLSAAPFAFIPKKNIGKAEAQLRDGDIVMLTAARPGLDMKHCGFVVREKDRVYLLHASSDQGRVVITSRPLAEYMLTKKHLSGIRVARFRAG